MNRRAGISTLAQFERGNDLAACWNGLRSTKESSSGNWCLGHRSGVRDRQASTRPRYRQHRSANWKGRSAASYQWQVVHLLQILVCGVSQHGRQRGGKGLHTFGYAERFRVWASAEN